MSPDGRTRLDPQQHLATRLWNRLRLGAVLKLSPKEFAKFIAEIENDPLFTKLIAPPDHGSKAIRWTRFNNSRFLGGFFENQQEQTADQGGIDVQSLMANRPGMIEIIQKIGQEKFEKYFLYPEEPYTQEELITACGITVSEVELVQSFLFDLSVQEEFNKGTPASSLQNQMHLHCAAKIEHVEKDRFAFAFTSAPMARGVYQIYTDRIQRIRQFLNNAERKQLSSIVHKMELANARQNAFFRILSELIIVQKKFLTSRQRIDLVALSERKLARQTNLSSSTVSRLVWNKSILLPWGEEVPLASLFPLPNQIGPLWVEDILATQKKNLSDAELALAIEKKFGVKIARRSINHYRHIYIERQKKS